VYNVAMTIRQQQQQRLRRGNLPFLLFLLGLASVWYGCSENSGLWVFSGSIGLVLAYAWQNALWILE